MQISIWGVLNGDRIAPNDLLISLFSVRAKHCERFTPSCPFLDQNDLTTLGHVKWHSLNETKILTEKCVYAYKSVQGGAKNGAILSHCKYSENSMTELRGNWWTSAILYAEQSQHDEIFKQKVNDCVQHIILLGAGYTAWLRTYCISWRMTHSRSKGRKTQKFTNFHGIR